MAFLCLAHPLAAKEVAVRSPDGLVALILSDEGGLHYRVEKGGKVLLADSPLGLKFAGGPDVGPQAKIGNVAEDHRDAVWENPFGIRRRVVDRWNAARVTVAQESGTPGAQPVTFNVVARASDDGVAFRYDIPASFGSGEFVLEKELTEFRFPANYRCWLGGESTSAEVNYPETTLASLPGGPDKPYRGVLPLLVQTPEAFVAIAESDLHDWAGLFLSGTGGNAVRAILHPRHDGRGAVVGHAPRTGPWRAIAIARTAAELVGSDFLVNLATPSRIGYPSWIQPGIAAWDVWWTGENPGIPEFTGIDARGDTRSHKEYIDFAAAMGWRYQLIDWFWYEHMTSYSKSLLSEPNSPSGDFTRSVPAIKLPELLSYARKKDVRLWIWAHSLDIRMFGVEKALAHFEKLGFAGVKIDFIDSQSQEAVQWCEELIAAASRHHLMIDLHGVFSPVGWARTWPNFLTQEGVLGNEYNKLPGNRCDARHTITLPFTRGLLGPMDFTPGGFLNRTPAEFRITHPAQVIGTRARQLAMAVMYPSPLLVLCDSPRNYRGQAGLEFFRDLPTVWDETVVLSADVGRHLALARRSGNRWWLVAMNGDDALTLEVPLDFLGSHPARWQVREFADSPDASKPSAVIASTHRLGNARTVTLKLSPAGGYAGILEPLLGENR